MAAATNAKTITIRANTTQAVGGVNNLNSALSALAGNNPSVARVIQGLNGTGGAATGAAGQVTNLTGRMGALGASAQAAIGQVSGLGGAMGSLATAGLVGGVAAITAGLIGLGSAALDASAKFESYRGSLATVLGSTDQASIAFDRMATFAAKTPFSLDQAVNGFIKLKALGLTPSEAAMTSYGNTASAMGKTLEQMIEAVADASTGEFERLKEFGIKASKQGDEVAFTFQNTTTKVKNNSAEIQAYLMNIGNTNFAGAMDKQAKTFNGIMSSFKDSIDQVLAKVGDNGLTSAMGGVVNLLQSGLTAITPVLTGLGGAMSGIINAVTAIVTGVGGIFGAINTGSGQSITFMERLSLILNGIGFAFEIVGRVAGAVLGAIGTAVGTVSTYLGSQFARALEYVGVTFKSGERSWSNSIFGIINTVSYVVQMMPRLFGQAISDIGKMFRALGSQIGKVWDGLSTGNLKAAAAAMNQDLGGIIADSFSRTERLVNRIGRRGNRIYNNTEAAEETKNRWLGRDNKKGGELDLSTPGGNAGSGSGKDDEAKKAADRQKRANEFWQTLKDQTTAAGMLSNQAEVYNKQLEYRKLVERDLTTDEKSRIATAMSELNTAKAITAIKQRNFDLQAEYTAETMRGKAATDAQKAVEDVLYATRVDALKKGVDVTSAAYQIEEKALRTQLEKNEALKEQADLLRKARDFAMQMSPGLRAEDERKKLDAQMAATRDAIARGDISSKFADEITAGYNAAKTKIEQDSISLVLELSPTAKRGAASATENARYNQAKAQLANLDLSPQARTQIEGDIEAAHSAALNRIANESFREWSEALSGIADMFGGKLGSIFGRAASALDRVMDNANGQGRGIGAGISKLLGQSDTFQKSSQGFLNGIKGALGNPMKSLSSGFADFKNTFSGGLSKGIAGAMGKMEAGGAIGGAIGGIGDMIGIKGFGKGAKIGGSLGGLVGGPVGSVIGSIGGGIISSLLTKTKSGGATLTGGSAADIALSGNSGAFKKVASGLAGSVQTGLSDIAAKLGGAVGAFGAITIGKRGDDYRVNTTGSTSLKGKRGAQDFGDDQAAAIAFAIKTAIERGAITGLDSVISKAVKGLDVDAAISFAGQWKAMLADMDQMANPIAASIKAIKDPIETMRKTMEGFGASMEEIAKTTEYETGKLKALREERLAGINDFIDQIKGESSGKTKFARYTDDLAAFNKLKETLASGGSVDEDKFKKLGGSVVSLAETLYGSSQRTQEARKLVLDTAEQFRTNINTEFDKAMGVNATVAAADQTTAAVTALSSALVSEAVIQTSLLKQIAASLGGSNDNYEFSGGASYNGQYQANRV